MRVLSVKARGRCGGCEATAEQEWVDLDLGIEAEEGGQVIGGAGNGGGRLETWWEVVGGMRHVGESVA